MKRNAFSIFSRARFAAAVALPVLFFVAPNALAQQRAPTPPVATAVSSQAAPATNAAAAANDARAEQLVGRALDAVGGSTFLGVQTVVARGYYTLFKDGVSLPPLTFVDYLVFPDRERTEFKGQGTRNIQVNTGTTGWTYNNTARRISDIKPEQAKDFQLAMRTSLDNILRGWWRKEGARLTYVGRREAGLAKRNEVVRLTYPDGFTVEFEFGAKDNLPYKIIYRRQNAEGEETEEEDRLGQHVVLGGVTLPFVIDHYRAGAQTSRINYDKIEPNALVPDELFARPADIKKIK